MVIEVKDLSFSYGSTQVLNHIVIEISGGAVGLLGPNGAGKSTLIKILLGFLKLETGNASVLGMDARTHATEVRQRVGYMPEDDCFIPGMNAVSFVSYAGELCGMPSRDAMQRAHEVLYYVGLDEARYRLVDTYSAGMKQRIKLAQALVHDPELLFLDEPTNGMDPNGREEMLDLIRDISTHKDVHIVLSSHLLPDVEYACREVIALDRGNVVVQGNIEELKDQPRDVFELKIKGDRDTYVAALERYNCQCELTAEAGLRVAMADSASAAGNLPAQEGHLFFKLALETGVQIRQLKLVRHSLEDIFAEAVGEE